MTVTQDTLSEKYHPIAEELIEKNYARAEELAINLIKSNPIDAQAWVFLGESLLYQGYKRTAKKVLNRGWILDPQATWVNAARKSLEGIDEGIERQDIEEILKVKKVSVSAAMICKNEERCIGKCLDSLVDAVDEIVLVDTGSTDNTLNIVERYPKVKVIHFDWCNDFSAARNAALPFLESDWVLWVDADEYLLEDDKAVVKEVAGLFDDIGIQPLLRVGHYNDITPNPSSIKYDVIRMYPLKQGIKFHGRIHEQVVPTSQNFFSKPVRIRFLHDGYSNEIINLKNKIQRNMRLLEMMVEEEPNNPAWLLFYGRETLTSGDTEKAETILIEAEKKAKETNTFGRILEIYSILINLYLTQNRFKEAEDVCKRCLDVSPNFPNALYYLARIQMENALNEFKKAEANLKMSKESFTKYRGTVSADNDIIEWKADLLTADLKRLTGDLVTAEKIYKNLAEKHPFLKGAKLQLDMINNQIEQLTKNG